MQVRPIPARVASIAASAVLVVSRDFFIIGGMLLAYMLGNPMEVHPLWVSKANTAAQMNLTCKAVPD